MDNYFGMVAREFCARSEQIRYIMKTHGPSIGVGHEVLLRSFLRDYLPKWVSIGHGFVRGNDGAMSNQTDLIIYNSTYYAPLYRIEDFVIIPPEALIASVEVKTKLKKSEFLKSISTILKLKKINPYVSASIFIFYPPNIATMKTYLESLDFSNTDRTYIIDYIYGFSKFVLNKRTLLTEELSPEGKVMKYKPNKIGICNDIYEGNQDYVFEIFFYNLYSTIEGTINSNIENGIDNWLWLRNGEMTHGGRRRFLNSDLKSTDIITEFECLEASEKISDRPGFGKGINKGAKSALDSC